MATEHRCADVWLESLGGLMDPAIRLYRRHGFIPQQGGAGTIDLDGIVVMARPLVEPTRRAG